MNDLSPEDQLAFDIGFGLKKAGMRMPIEVLNAAAKLVVQHLKLCRWEFGRKAPKEAHGPALPKTSEGRPGE